jgi:hypothetical protein
LSEWLLKSQQQDAWEDLIGRRLAGLREDKVKDGAYCVGVNDSGGRECSLLNAKPTLTPNALPM